MAMNAADKRDNELMDRKLHDALLQECR